MIAEPVLEYELLDIAFSLKRHLSIVVSVLSVSMYNAPLLTALFFIKLELYKSNIESLIFK